MTEIKKRIIASFGSGRGNTLDINFEVKDRNLTGIIIHYSNNKKIEYSYKITPPDDKFAKKVIESMDSI